MDRKDYNAILIPVAEFFRLRELLRPPMPGLASPWCRCPPTERTLWTPATKQSSVADPWHFGVDPDPRIHASDRILDPDPAIFVIDLQDASKKQICYTIFSAYFLKVHLHHFSKMKSQKESQNSKNQGFSYYFCMMIEGSGSRSIPLTSGSGSGRPKIMWIRWIRNTATKAYC